MAIERHFGEYLVSTDRSRLDLDVVHAFLSASYWAKGRSRARLERAVAHSLCFGAYAGGAQVGFCRVISDRAVTAHLVDVFVLEAHRGCGLGRAIVEAALGHPDLAECRWTLFTADAHAFYEPLGFERDGARLMRRPGVADRPL